MSMKSWQLCGDHGAENPPSEDLVNMKPPGSGQAPRQLERDGIAMPNLLKTQDQHKPSKAFLDLVYPVPPEVLPDEQYFHDDIPQMNDSQRRRELERVRLRLLLDPKPHSWLFERMDRLEEAFDHAK